jgi:hypothetical protein
VVVAVAATAVVAAATAVAVAEAATAVEATVAAAIKTKSPHFVCFSVCYYYHLLVFFLSY